MSHSSKDESTVGVDSGPIRYLSVSCLWHIAFATSLSSRPGIEARVVINADICFNWKD